MSYKPTKQDLENSNCGMTKEQADIAHEVCVLSATLKNPEAFKLVSDEVWKINQRRINQ